MTVRNIFRLRGVAVWVALGFLAATFVGACSDDMRSPDQERAAQLLPNRNEYADSNLQTHEQARLVAGKYASRLDLI